MRFEALRAERALGTGSDACEYKIVEGNEKVQ